MSWCLIIHHNIVLGPVAGCFKYGEVATWRAISLCHMVQLHVRIQWCPNTWEAIS